MHRGISITTTHSCYHCGQQCADDHIHIQDKVFCCDGCKTVYEILQSNDLCSYYSLEETPGITINTAIDTEKFEYLDTPEVADLLLSFKKDNISHVSFRVSAIHCTSCIWLLEHLRKIDEGVLSSKVNFMKREVDLVFDNEKISLRRLVELMTSIGYEPEINLGETKKVDNSEIKEKLWLKLGVAGFAFGNIMLFSFPEYLSMDSLEKEFAVVFGVLNIALSLPVLLFSAQDYLKSAFQALKHGGTNLDVPISIGLLALYGRSLYEIIGHIGPGYMDSFSGFVFFLLLGKLVQQKTVERLSFDRDYKSYFPLSVTRITGYEKEQHISVEEIEIGDSLYIRNEELVPCDSILLSEKAELDYSFVSGESEKVKVLKGEKIYAGGRISGSSVLIRATKNVSNSYLTKLWNDTAFEKDHDDKKIQRFADKISGPFTVTVIGIATISLITWFFIEPSRAIDVFTSVLIVACPCALALSSPFTLSAAVNVLSKHDFYVKNAGVLENLARVNTIVFDKTGTLTSSESAEMEFVGASLSDDDKKALLATAAHSTHPISRKMASFYRQELSGQELPTAISFKETSGKGISAKVEGLEVVIGSLAWLEDNNIVIPNKVADLQVYVAIDDLFKGGFGLKNKIRAGIQDLIENLQKKFKLYLLSGDSSHAKTEFLPLFKNEAQVHFGQSPQDKLRFIKELQSDPKQKVLMIGDGLNDAGALRQSDFGVALAENVSSFSPASDAIIKGSELIQLDRFVKFARAGLAVILASFGLSLLYNITGLAFAVTGYLSPLVSAILMPLSSLTVIVFTTVTISLIAKKMRL